MADRDLLGRSPRSRKSVGAVEEKEKENRSHNFAVAKLANAKAGGRKRAVSIGGGILKHKEVELSPRRKLRRSLVPRKSILKPSNNIDETTFGFTDTTQLISDGDGNTRKSMGMGSRRVSFAAEAFVRYIPNNDTDSPANPNLTMSSNNLPPSHLPQPGATVPAPRRSSVAFRRQSGVDDNGEASMSMDMDDSGNPPPFTANQGYPLSGSAIADDDDDLYDDDGMELTGVIPNESYNSSMELTSIMPSRCQSENGEQTMELTIAIEEAIPRLDEYGNQLPAKSPALAGAWAALESTTHSTGGGDGEDMELEDAMRRLRAAQVSFSADPREDGETPDDDSSSSDSDHGGDIDFEHTMTMDITSVVGGIRGRSSNISASRHASPERRPSSSLGHNATPQRQRAISPAAPSIFSAIPKSPSSKIPVFTAAFAPSYQPPKRPRSVSAPSPSSTPNKRVAARPSPASKRIAAPSPAPPLPPIVFAPASPVKETHEVTPVEAVEVEKAAPASSIPLKRVSSSFAMRRRKSSVLPAQNIFSSSTSTRTPAPAQSEPIPTSVARPESPQCTREATRQSLVPGNVAPSRGSPSPASPRPKSPGVKDVTAQDPQTSIYHETVSQIVAPVSRVTWGGETVDRSQLDQEKPPSISIAQFLEMTGVLFLDNLVINRLSTFRGRTSTGSNDDEGPRNFSISDYAIAQLVFAPQLESYNWCCRELKTHIHGAQESLKVYEADVEINSPLVFQDYLASDEEKRDIIEQLFKVHKYHARLETKSEWYNFRQNIVANLQSSADEHLKKLEESRAVLSNFKNKIPSHLPEAREEYARLKVELEQEREAIARVEDCDQDSLTDLREGIAEQNLAISGYKSDIADGTAVLNKVLARLNDIDSEKQALEDAITAAQNLCDKSKGYTTAKVFKLRDEFEALQRMHLWRFSKITESNIDLTFDEHIGVSISCHKYTPLPGRTELSLLKDRIKGKNAQFPLISDIMVEAAKEYLTQYVGDLDAIIRSLSVLWTSVSSVRSELRLLMIKHPVRLARLDDVLQATTTLLFPAASAKALVTFSFSKRVLYMWPTNVGDMQCDVNVVYGQINSKNILDMIQNRINSVHPGENHGVLLDACADALSLY